MSTIIRSFSSAAISAVCCALIGYGIAAGWVFKSARAEAPPPTGTIKLIKVSAKRFEFIPHQITLKKGETVDIELGTEDVVMGFNVPEMASRATLLPGQVSHLKLTPQKIGTFTFLCDVFCGSGHEDMDGVITVVE